jgi:hypothetical protein
VKHVTQLSLCSTLTTFNTLKSIYFEYFHSIITYGIIFWGNSSNSRKIFIMVRARHTTSCRSLFQKLEILPVPCQYIFSLMNFLVNNQEDFQTNSSGHTVLIQGISTIFIDQLPACLVLEKCLLFWHQNFQQFTKVLQILRMEKHNLK